MESAQVFSSSTVFIPPLKIPTTASTPIFPFAFVANVARRHLKNEHIRRSQKSITCRVKRAPVHSTYSLVTLTHYFHYHDSPDFKIERWIFSMEWCEILELDASNKILRIRGKIVWNIYQIYCQLLINPALEYSPVYMSDKVNSHDFKKLVSGEGWLNRTLRISSVSSLRSTWIGLVWTVNYHILLNMKELYMYNKYF